ncbi:MAG: cobaltochelatase subunit CobN [Bacteroidales bacterium]|nr:cobaltochelatase subunit CobN [Bacteroidales bacterium]
MSRKKIIGLSILAVILISIAIIFWNLTCSTTKIAFVNYQVTTLGQISKSNQNSFIKIKEVATDDLEQLRKFDMVFINAMGLRITAEQRAMIQQMADNGLSILTTAATNPDNKIISVDEEDENTLIGYLGNGGRKNYSSMLNYVRRYIDGKSFFVKDIFPAVEAANDMIYHPNLKNPQDEDLGFNSVGEYENFLRNNNLYNEKAPRIIISGPMGDATDLIKALENTGNMVYPVRNIVSFIRNRQIDSVQPSAVINMAHGRMGDMVVEYLKQQNIPLFLTLYVPQPIQTWEDDKMGMSGGFLSQSVVVPEIDGAIRPFVVFAHRMNKEGLQEIYAIPERLNTFVATINNYIHLQNKANRDKKIVIYYYKGAGQNALTAAGMDVLPSLYNLLARLKREGYKVDNLPASAEDLGKMIQRHGAVLGTYAEGAFGEFMKNGNPELISKEQYESWIKQSLTAEMYQEVIATNGEFPGTYMATEDGQLGVARLQFGNIVLMPQPMAGIGDNTFKIVHGTDAAPPHTYIAAYLWAQYGFQADAMIHFGTHGSLEFTPRKQVALSRNDWPDRLVGATPHFYIYSISNVGEAMIAKRRSYAGIVSYLTPPFMESNVRGQYRELTEAIKTYYHTLENGNKEQQNKASLAVKQLTVQLGIHLSLDLDSIATNPYTEEEINRIENFAEELSTEKMTGQLYTMGVPYEDSRIASSVYAMTTDPIAYSLLALHKQKGKATADVEKHKSVFTARYSNPAKQLVSQLLNGQITPSDATVCKIAGISANELEQARQIAEATVPKDLMSMMMSMADEGGVSMVNVNRNKSGNANGKPNGHPHKLPKGMSGKTALNLAKMMGAPPEALKKMEAALNKDKQKQKPSVQAKSQDTAAENISQAQMAEAMKTMMTGNAKTYSKDEIALSKAIMEVERAVRNVEKYKTLLQQSPENELKSLVNALNGGYIAPTPGGDPIVNPNTLPTGRNLFGVNAENTPSESAWEKGKLLAEKTIANYRQRHHDSIPRKVSYTLWSGEFIETEGATIAQILYMLGVEPVRDVFGRVTDLRLIPSKELGRPRIDVLVQTSGQLRDIASSRLFLINRAVTMAANAKDDNFENQVSAGVVESEKALIAKGLSPKEAREISTYRVFGGVNGGYGTGIQGMVQAGDRWENEQEIADVYLNNMGAFYGDEKNWETVKQYAFEAALSNTDAVVQPRQSNTWGALSLDHVYEFMGGLNLAVRNVTGKDPDAYLSDYRNHNNFRMQEVKEAIGVESRTTIFNPNYIAEKMKGGASEANEFAEIIQNTYGWNVMKPQAIDNDMWNEIYNVYVKDKFNLNVQNYFENTNPAALEEMTAVMLETARKGMWKASEQQINNIAKLHTDLVNKYKPSCSGFVCDNAKLRQYIAEKVDKQTANQYNQNIKEIREASANTDNKGMVMKKEQLNENTNAKKHFINNLLVGIGVLAAVALLVFIVRKRRKNMSSEI